MGSLSKSYYLKPKKIIRDLVHEYINLTEFDLELIDTVEFQRLGDIRQLTCQHVYPAARHTRFEHSLGVLELMRSAIGHLNRNGILGQNVSDNSSPIISENLEFSAAVAALLHDVGHCPFSHMGETQFDKEIVRTELTRVVKEFEPFKDSKDLIKRLEGKGDAGSVHEQLSCIVILKKYSTLLLNLGHYAEEEDSCDLNTDFELIVRSILGIEYKMETLEDKEDNQLKNVIVNLLHSNIFDVDKLDYIMRDSYLTGIGTPAIDTQRLFRNMFLDDKYLLVFTSKAVPVLQNMIDARDGLYLYVYNHHAVVYSDYMYTYISRRLAHNAKAFFRYAYPSMSEEEVEEETEISQISGLGLVPRTYLFSVDSVVKQGYSDSALLSLLSVIHVNYCLLLNAESQGGVIETIKNNIQETLKELAPVPYAPKAKEETGDGVFSGTEPQFHNHVEKMRPEEVDELADRIYNTMRLIHQAMERDYLKPWWKTVYEFSNFMNHNFRDDRLQKYVGRFICDGGKHGLKADEMRSQIAKHVVHITQRLEEDGKGSALGLIEALHEGEFFVIQRPTNFFSANTIEKLEIALKDSEILGPSADANRHLNKYYLKTLTKIIPQKDYSSIYAKESFYVFSKSPFQKSTTNKDFAVAERKHYELLENIFVYVATAIVNMGEQEFVRKYQGVNCRNSETKRKEDMEDMYDNFIKWMEAKG